MFGERGKLVRFYCQFIFICITRLAGGKLVGKNAIYMSRMTPNWRQGI